MQSSMIIETNIIIVLGPSWSVAIIICHIILCLFYTGVLQKWNLSTRKIICACLVVVVAILYVTGLPDWNTIKFMAKGIIIIIMAKNNYSIACIPKRSAKSATVYNLIL